MVEKEFPSNWRWLIVRVVFKWHSSLSKCRHIFEINWHYLRTNTLRATMRWKYFHQTPSLFHYAREFLILIYFDDVAWKLLVGWFSDKLARGCVGSCFNFEFIENLFAFTHAFWRTKRYMNCTCEPAYVLPPPPSASIQSTMNFLCKREKHHHIGNTLGFRIVRSKCNVVDDTLDNRPRQLAFRIRITQFLIWPKRQINCCANIIIYKLVPPGQMCSVEHKRFMKTANTI